MRLHRKTRAAERAEPKGMLKPYLAFQRERRAGGCEAPRRRRCGVIVEERQRSRCPQARWRCCWHLTCNPACSSLAPGQRAWGPAAKCQVILEHALRIEISKRGDEHAERGSQGNPRRKARFFKNNHDGRYGCNSSGDSSAEF